MEFLIVCKCRYLRGAGRATPHPTAIKSNSCDSITPTAVALLLIEQFNVHGRAARLGWICSSAGFGGPSAYLMGPTKNFSSGGQTLSLQDQIVLVAGGSSAIGLVTAQLTQNAAVGSAHKLVCADAQTVFFTKFWRAFPPPLNDGVARPGRCNT